MSQTASASERRGLWVYAICQQVDEASLPSLTGVGGAAVTAVTASGLTAVAEGVGLGEFGEQALRANLEDMAWLEATARAHHGVIDAIARHAPAVPMRLATVYSSEAAVQTMLAARSAEIFDVLDRITSRREWGVKAFAVAATSRDGAASSASKDDRSAGSGAAYLRRRRDELSAQQLGRRQAVSDAERVHDGLSRIAVAARLHALQTPRLTATTEPMVLNAAYLTGDGQDRAVRQEVTALAKQCSAVRLELTGPWPPYSFAEMPGGTDG
jgi:Gas vesicle synthesis protein GvpL/GvpF